MAAVGAGKTKRQRRIPTDNTCAVCSSPPESSAAEFPVILHSGSCVFLLPPWCGPRLVVANRAF